MARSRQPAGQRNPARGKVKRQIENRVRQCCVGNLEIAFQARGLGGDVQNAAPFHLPTGKARAEGHKLQPAPFKRDLRLGVLHRRQPPNRDARGVEAERAVQRRQKSQWQRFLICQIKRRQGQVFRGNA